MINNAKDSLRQAVELIATSETGSTQAQLKHSIIASAHCVELLLKERLRQINPAFIWENVDKYPSLEARTVTAATAINRLQSIGGVDFSAEDIRDLTSLRKTRNAIEHYEWHTSEKEAKIIIGHALSFAFCFGQAELNVDFSETFKADDTWKLLLGELREFANAHGARLASKLYDKGEFPNCCDECGEFAVPTRGGSCELCGHWQAVDD